MATNPSMAINASRHSTDDVAPLHRQIRDHILHNIFIGAWQPKRRIPSENELMKQFRVSRMTVHHCLRELCKDGFLTRTPGLGTFVAMPQAHLTVIKIVDVAQTIRQANREHIVDVVERIERRATTREAEVFRVSVGAPLFHVVLVHKGDNIPVQVEDRLVNANAAPEYLEGDHSLDAFAYLSRLYPYPEGRHVISAICPTKRLKRLLQLDTAEPCLEIQRTTWVGKLVITTARLFHPASRYKIEGSIEHR
jgi:GntR family histidine utilization transcriptional repressor